MYKYISMRIWLLPKPSVYKTLGSNYWFIWFQMGSINSDDSPKHNTIKRWQQDGECSNTTLGLVQSHERNGSFGFRNTLTRENHVLFFTFRYQRITIRSWIVANVLPWEILRLGNSFLYSMGLEVMLIYLYIMGK